MAVPTMSEIETIVNNATEWVANRVRKAPNPRGVDEPSKMVVSMYPAWPVIAKVPSGYTIPSAQGPRDYVRHLGDELVWTVGITTTVLDSINLELVLLNTDNFHARAKVGPWADGQPSLFFDLYRTYYADGSVWTRIHYDGKPSDDTREYPVKMYFAGEEFISDHRTADAGLVFEATTHGSAGLNGNKYFIRTENIPASKLLKGTPEGDALRTFHLPLWNDDDDLDIHSPLFAVGYDKPDDYMFSASGPMYFDCSADAPAWPRDDYRGASQGGWGFSHRSKVCTFPQAYTEVLRQDGLGLLAQAIHVLMKYGDPDHEYESPWPYWLRLPFLGRPSNPTTPKKMADFVWDRWYVEGVGVSMFGIPVVGGDGDKASSLRTNQMLVLQTLLGYHSGQGEPYVSRADIIAEILAQVQVGHPPQPANGVKTPHGEFIRPTFTGSQLFGWETVGSLGVGSFGFVRDQINKYFGLPFDDLDFLLSTVEATATYAQAFRVYLYYKYGRILGEGETIPGSPVNRKGKPILTGEGFVGQRFIVDDYFRAGETLRAGDVVAIRQDPDQDNHPRLFRVIIGSGGTEPSRLIGIVHTPPAMDVGGVLASAGQFVPVVVQGIAKTHSSETIGIGVPVTPSGSIASSVARVKPAREGDPVVGRCLSSATTANENVDILVDLAVG